MNLILPFKTIVFIVFLTIFSFTLFAQPVRYVKPVATGFADGGQGFFVGGQLLGTGGQNGQLILAQVDALGGVVMCAAGLAIVAQQGVLAARHVARWDLLQIIVTIFCLVYLVCNPGFWMAFTYRKHSQTGQILIWLEA